jgi:hypothetical protein
MRVNSTKATHAAELRARLAVLFFFCALLATFFWAQPLGSGFEPGHHGWVSAHNLAAIEHLSWRSGLAGYSIPTFDKSGHLDYQSFARSPFPFSAAMKALLSACATSANEKIYFARQAMNGIFVAAMLMAYLVVRRVGASRVGALTAVLLAFAGYYTAYYRDLVSSDLPGVLGLLVVVYGIATYRQTGNAWPLYVCTLIGGSLGIYFAALMALGLHAVLEGCQAVATSQSGRRSRLTELLGSAGLRALLLGVLVTGAHIAFNTSMEAEFRGVHIAETSIVDSASRRLGFDADFSQRREQPLTWSLHGAKLAERTLLALTPYPPLVPETHKRAMEWYVHRLGSALHMIGMLGAVALLVWFIRGLDLQYRPVVAVLALSGFLGLAAMKNLFLPHSYTSIYLVGLGVTLFLAVVHKLPRNLQNAAFVVALMLFLSAHFSARQSRIANQSEATIYTADFERIAERLPPGARVHLAGEYRYRLDGAADVVPGAPYAVGFYLPEAFFGPLEGAQYVVSRQASPAMPGGFLRALTPENSRVFAFAALPDAER